MDFSWTEEQDRLYDEAAAFAEAHLANDLLARDASMTFDRDAWGKAAEFGVLGCFVPEAWGGRGLDLITSVRLLEGIGYGCRDNGITLGLNGQLWSVQEPILNVGTDDQKKRYLAPMCRGEMLGAHALTEAGSGSDTYALASTARKVDGGYRLDGTKIYIGLAPYCDMAMVFAKTNPDAGKWGISIFLVDADSDGFVVSDPQPKMGLRTEPVGTLRLEDCFVPEENRLGPEGAGLAICHASMDYERSFILSSHVGSMARQLETCVAFAREREQYGQAIGGFQAVSHRIANMSMRLEHARLMLYKLAWMKSRGTAAMAEAAMTKIVIAEAFVENSLDAVRIHGGRGYMTEFEVERDLRDAMGGVIYAGTSDIQRNIIAGCLGL